MGSSLKHPVLNTGPSAEAETTIVAQYKRIKTQPWADPNLIS